MKARAGADTQYSHALEKASRQCAALPRAEEGFSAALGMLASKCAAAAKRHRQYAKQLHQHVLKCEQMGKRHRYSLEQRLSARRSAEKQLLALRSRDARAGKGLRGRRQEEEQEKRKLAELTADDLKELGFKMGDRKRVLKWSAAQ